jgi:sugar/nucleoside kinase (ribokinase family)
LRRGANGAIVHRTDTGETWSIPAVETTVVDPTGAGNAFCGGFLAGWVQTGNLLTAGLYGVVAASFLVEQVGLPESSEAARLGRGEEARRRLAGLQAKDYRL